MRRKVTNRKTVEADLRYQSVLVAKLINQVMYDGKKSVAERVVYSSLEKAEQKLGKTALEILDMAVDNAGPKVELRSRRIGGANYQVPYETRPESQLVLAIRWIIDAARTGKGKPMADKLSEELINAVNNTGVAVKKKQDTHRMADANKAFAHFAW